VVTQAQTSNGPRAPRVSRGPDAPALALGALLLVTTLLRLVAGANRPLWLDEAWTGMIVSQTSFSGFVRQCYLDINAPLYYLIAALWAQVAGLSDAALRFPALLFGCLVPFAALLPGLGASRPVRFVWCGLLACWIPGLYSSHDARCYTLALLLGVVSTLAYARLLRSPTVKRAWLWTVLSSLLILTHYYGVVLVALQGTLYLAIHRVFAARPWPAAMGEEAAAASLAAHAALLAKFTDPGVSWLPTLGAGVIPAPARLLIGTALLAGAAAVCVWAARRRGRLLEGPGAAECFQAKWVLVRRQNARQNEILERRSDSIGADSGPEASGEPLAPWIAAAASFAAVVAAIGGGFFRPVFEPRYLTTFMPGALLGLALFIQRFSSDWKPAPAALVALFFAAFVAWSVRALEGFNVFNFETASEALMARRPPRLVFLWDGPMRPDASALIGAGGFFFRRAGVPVTVIPVSLAANEDPNQVLLAHARQPGTAILWIYDLGVQGTAAARYPPRISLIDPRRRCRDFGRGDFGAIACDATAAPAAKAAPEPERASIVTTPRHTVAPGRAALPTPRLPRSGGA